MTHTPCRIQRRRARGWRMPDGAVFVGRPTRWGNPFRIAKHGGLYRVFDANHLVPSLSDPDAPYLVPDRFAGHAFAVRTYELHIGPLGRYQWEDPEAMLEPLRGRDLACWCPPDLPCHADSLLRLANDWPDE